jgi:hypothetical protein
MGRTSARLLTAFVLVLGLLGMHGLSSSHDGMPGMPAMTGGAAAALVMTTDHALAAVPAVVQALPRATAVGHAAMADAGRAMTHPWCIAVLLGSLLLLVLTLLRLRPPAWHPPVRTSRGTLPAVRALRPPDLVAGLCVSRT